MRISDWSSDVCSSDLDVLGRAPGAPLWPERFGLDYLEGFRRRNPRGFSALYMQRPTPQDGDFFKSDMVLPYKRADLPPRLRIRSEEHTSELQSLMRISYAVFCLKKKKNTHKQSQ